MNNQNLELKNYDLKVLSNLELIDLNGGHWIEYVWKAFDALTKADAINDAVNGLRDGFNSGYNKSHGVSGTW